MSKIVLFNPKINGRQTQGFYEKYSGCFYRRYYEDFEYLIKIDRISYQKMKRKNVKFEKTTKTPIYCPDNYSKYELDIFKQIDDIDRKVRILNVEGKIRSDKSQDLIEKRSKLVEITKKFSKEF